MLILPPIELCDYIELENEKVIVVIEIPNELQAMYEEFKQKFESSYQKKESKL